MEGITEQQPPSRNCDIDGSNYLTITLKKSAEGRFTTAQLCQRIRYFPGRLFRVTVRWEDRSEYPDSDLEALGDALHDLPCLDELYIYGTWTDEKASPLLRRVANPSIRALRIATERFRRRRIPTILAEMQVAGFPSLRSLQLFHIDVDDSDCGSLGQMLQCLRQQRQGFTVILSDCLFATINGYLAVADAAIKNGHFLSFHGNSVTDASIPDNTSDSTTIHQESHRIFYNMYEQRYKELKQEYKDKCNAVNLKARSFHVAAKKHMNGYNDLNRAGLWELSSKYQTATVQEWVDAVCHDRVRDRVDHIFHFLTMNPDVYANAALGRSKAVAATANNNNMKKTKKMDAEMVTDARKEKKRKEKRL